MENNESGDEMAGAFSGYIVQSDDIEGKLSYITTYVYLQPEVEIGMNLITVMKIKSN